MAFKWIYSLRLGLRLNWRILLLVECVLDARSLTQLKMQRQTVGADTAPTPNWACVLRRGGPQVLSHRVTAVKKKAVKCIL